MRRFPGSVHRQWGGYRAPLPDVAALESLPGHYRTALLLKDGLGSRAEDVAGAMGVTVPAARSILHRARRSCG